MKPKTQDATASSSGNQTANPPAPVIPARPPATILPLFLAVVGSLTVVLGILAFALFFAPPAAEPTATPATQLSFGNAAVTVLHSDGTPASNLPVVFLSGTNPITTTTDSSGVATVSADVALPLMVMIDSRQVNLPMPGWSNAHRSPATTTITLSAP